VPPPARAAYVGDGKWHHFGERREVVTPNRDGANPAVALRSPLK
jgi:hypothetical protein